MALESLADVGDCLTLIDHLDCAAPARLNVPRQSDLPESTRWCLVAVDPVLLHEDLRVFDCAAISLHSGPTIMVHVWSLRNSRIDILKRDRHWLIM